MDIYINNGVDVDPTWTQSIVFSNDNVDWHSIAKDGLAVKPIFMGNTNNDRFFYPFAVMTRVRLEYSDGKVAAEFELQELKNQPTWILGTKAALRQAVSDIQGWL